MKENINNSSETGLQARSCKIIQDKCGTRKRFEQWFVGFTDGDGCFSIYTNQKTNKINLTFKIDQKVTNLQVLYYIKRKMGVGKVSRPDKNGMCKYQIRTKEHLRDYIIPLFDKNELHTQKYNDYIRFKKALEIWTNNTLEQTEKVQQIKNLQTSFNRTELVFKPLSDDWIVGFTEADGSFFLTHKEKNRIVHAFGITQKLDKHILEEIRKRFTIKSQVRLGSNKCWQLETTNQQAIKRIKNFFFKRLKGRMSLIYRIWARSIRHRGKYKKLLLIQEHLRKL